MRGWLALGAVVIIALIVASWMGFSFQHWTDLQRLLSQ